MLEHKYKIFCRLAQNPNTTKVAEELLLSQPAISKSIRELEKELGITLFNRQNGRMQLTEAGKYLYSEVEQLMQREREISFEMNKIRELFSGTLHVGASTTLSQYVLPEVLARFTKKEPQMKMVVTSGNTSQIEQEILSGNLHVAFIEGTPTQPDIHYIPYLKDEIVLVTAKHTPIEESIPCEKLSSLPFVFREIGSGTYRIIQKQLKTADIDINDLSHQLIFGTTEGIKHYLLHSACFSLLSVYSIQEELIADKLKIVEIEGLSIPRTFYIIHRQGEPDPYARQFIEFCQK